MDDKDKIDWQVVKEPHEASGQPAVEGAGKSTKPVLPEGSSQPNTDGTEQYEEEPYQKQASGSKTGSTPAEAERKAGVLPKVKEADSAENKQAPASENK